LGFYRKKIVSKEPTFSALFDRREFAENISELKEFSEKSHGLSLFAYFFGNEKK